MRTLIFGYGNADRQDDGVAWHILKEIMTRNHLPVSDELDIDYQDETNQVDYVFQLQLTPEIAYDLNKYDRVCFIDAHTGAVPEDVHFERVQSRFQNSPFTHHLTASSLLSIAETLHKKIPETILVSVRGFSFGFSRFLSDETIQVSSQATDIIMRWMAEV
ncbi:MAG: hoxW [Chloroflexi bacterium]|nr:MAG: hoxW [Chloroflexota bacterium]